MLSSAARNVAALALLAIAGCGPSADSAASSEFQSGSLPKPPVPAVVAGRLDSATLEQLNKLTAAVQSAPEDAEAWAELGAAYEALRVPQGAEVAFVAAATLRPADPKLWYRAAIMSQARGDVELALKHLGRTLELAPDYGPAWRRRGTWLLDLGRAEEAGGAFQQAERLLPGRADGQLGLARVALALDEVQAGVQAARIALERAPGDAYARNILGSALRRAGLLDEAKPHLVAGQNSTPVYVDPWSESAQRSRRKEEEEVERAESLIDAKRWDEAIVLLQELQVKSPANSKLALRLGVALMSARRFEEAVQHYRAAVAAFPAIYDLQTASVAALNATGRVAEALKVADETIARWPDRSPAHLQRGSTLERMADFGAARVAFQRASQLKPSDLRGSLFEGRMLAKLGRMKEAAQVFETGLDQPGASPPMVYYKNLVAALTAVNADQAHLERIVARARKLHGAAADTLLP